MLDRLNNLFQNVDYGLLCRFSHFRDQIEWNLFERLLLENFHHLDGVQGSVLQVCSWFGVIAEYPIGHQ